MSLSIKAQSGSSQLKYMSDKTGLSFDADFLYFVNRGVALDADSIRESKIEISKMLNGKRAFALST